MYKLVSVCLAFSLIVSAADVKAVNQATNIEIKKTKPSSHENSVVKISHSVSTIKQEVSTKKIKKQKENELSAQKKEALYNRLNEEKKLSTEIQVNNKTDHAIVQENNEEFNKSSLIEKLEISIEEQSPRSPAYIQGPKKVNTPNIQAVRDHESVFISEVAEGSSNNKYIEIYNGTGSDVDLSGYSLSSCSNGCDTENQFDYPDNVTFASGTTLADGDVFVVCHGSASDGIAAECDQTFTYLSNGDDFFALTEAGATADTYVVVDKVGDFGDDPGSGWSVAGVSNGTKDYTLVRKSSVQSGNTDWAASAGTSTDDSEWIVTERPTADYTPSTLGSHEMDAEEVGPYLSEGFESTFPSGGVGVWETSGDGPWAQDSGDDFGPGFAASGDFCVFFNDYDYSTGVSGVLSSPDVDLTSATQPILKFQYWDSSGSDDVEVQVSNPDGSYTTVLTTPTSTIGWEELSYDLSAYVGQVVKVRFVGTSVYGYSNPHIDDVSIAEPPTFPIASLSTNEIDFGSTFITGSKSANFAITNEGGSELTASISSDNSKFSVSTASVRIAPGETTAITVTYSPTDESNDVGNITVTHDGDSSPDVVVVSGTGTLNVLDENFDGPWTGDPAAPSGWQVVNVDGGLTWRQGNTYIPEVDVYAAYGSGNNDDWLISPTMSLVGHKVLKWWDVVESASYPNNFDVYVFPGGFTGDASTGVNLGAYVCTNTELTQHSVDLGAYNGQTVSIAFHQTYSASSGWGFGIDDVTVEDAPTEPIVVVEQESIDWTPVYVSTSSQKTLSVSNEGGADATGTISSTNDKFVVSTATLAIAAGATQEITITYTPTEVSTDFGFIEISHNGDDEIDSVLVTGSGTLAILTEGFDEPWVGDPSAPEGWSQISVSGPYTWEQRTFGTYAGAGCAYGRWASSGGEYVLISPAVDLTDGYNLKYYVDGSTSSGTNLRVQISTSNTDATTGWTDLAYYVAGDNMPSTYEEQIINLSAYTGTHYIAFRVEDLDGYSVYLDEVTVEPLPLTPILAVSSSDIAFIATPIGSSSSATVGISNTGAGDLSGTITYSDGFSGPATFSSSDASINIDFSPTASGMFDGTVSIASNGGDAVIAVSGVAGKSVANWDTDLDGDGEADWPAGWQEAQEVPGVGSGWEFIGGGGYTGDGYTSAGYGPFGTVNSDWLISPKYSVQSGESFMFYASDDGGSISYPDIMTVHVSPSGGSGFADFTVELDSVANMGTSWLPYSYDLSAYAGTEVRIAIVYRGEYGYGLNVDDVAAPEIVVEAGPVIYDYPTVLDFGTADVGGAGTLLFDYFNTGGSDLEVTAVTFEGPFSLASDVSLPIVTASGGIGSFQVVFSPTEDGSFAGSMTVVSNAGDDLSIPLYGIGFGGVYREDFGYVGEDGYLTPWSAGWMFSDDGVMCPTDQACSNGTGASWGRASISGQGLMYHTYNSATDADTAISAAITLPELADGYHYELDTEEYMSYGSDANDINGFAISVDGGATFTLIAEPNYSASGVHSNNYDLTGYDGQTVHIALVYRGTFAQAWGVLSMEIRAKEDPVIPIFASSKLVFPVTALGESTSKKVYYQNVGAGNLSADISYPASMTGPASITELAPGVLDSMVVTYTPSTAGIETGDIVVDGSASGAAIVGLGVEANAGELAFDLVSRNAGWKQYSLAGDPWVAPSGTVYPGTWRWWGGAGHGSANFYGVYSYPGYWGGVDDYLVSPRYDISDASEVLSFFTRGGDNTERDSINVWVSTEEPIMGFVIEEGGRVDTGFVNTDAFSLAFESLPTNIGGEWDPVNIDLSAYTTDVWVMIQSVQWYNDAGEPSGWRLEVDDLGTPDIYMNPNPVLYVGKQYNFGVTQPSGDSVRYYLRNTGMQDLVIDNMEFENGDYFDVAYNSTFPITIVPGGIDSIDVYWMPQESGVQVDTLVYYSNYTVGDVDAFGNGTDHSVFIAEAFNAPPSPVALIGPADETVLTIDGSNAEGQTGIFWTNSTDPDGYPIEYFLELIVENTGDTLDTLISQSNFFLSHEEVLEYMTEVGVTELNIMWDVYAYDGFEDVESSNGPWSLTIDGGWALSVDNNTLPEVFALHNNYPNPFNPITNIRYDIPEASDVRIDIYDLVGKKVKTLVSKQHQPGRYKIQWNATNEFGSAVATGMYIYKIQAKDFVSVKKLLLMK